MGGAGRAIILGVGGAGVAESAAAAELRVSRTRKNSPAIFEMPTVLKCHDIYDHYGRQGKGWTGSRDCRT